jgi:hypothetical protein
MAPFLVFWGGSTAFSYCRDRNYGATPEAATGLTMPRRKHTREYNRRRSIEAECKLNDEYVAERNKPPPF